MASDTELVELIKEQNRLLQQQNALLQENRANLVTTRSSEPQTGGERRMMTEYDLQLILMAVDISKAISNWNKHSK
jgi:hypothetical protein